MAEDDARSLEPMMGTELLAERETAWRAPALERGRAVGGD